MVGNECQDHLVLFPFVPYAVSLSLSIAYREMRRNKVPMYRARARADLQTNCHILEVLGEIFWSASIMADVGKSTLRELDRAYASIANSQQRRTQQEVTNGAVNSTNGIGDRSSSATNQGMYEHGADASRLVSIHLTNCENRNGANKWYEF